MIIWEDTQILPGAEWDNEIKKHLASAEIVLFFVSNNSLKSSYFNEVEVKMALHSKPLKRIIPIYLDGVPTDFSQSPLASFQGIHYSGNPSEVIQQIERLFAHIREQRKATLSPTS